MSTAPSTAAKPPMANGTQPTGSPALNANTRHTPTPSPTLTALPPPVQPAQPAQPSAFTSLVSSLVARLQQPSYPLPVDPAAIVQQLLLSHASHFAHLSASQLLPPIASFLSSRLPGHQLSAVSSHLQYHTDRLLCSLLSSHGFPSSPSIPHIVDDGDDEDEGGAHSIRGISSGSLHLFPDLYAARLHTVRTALSKAAVRGGGGNEVGGPVLLLPSIPNGHGWLDRLLFDLGLPSSAAHFVDITPYLHIQDDGSSEAQHDKSGKQDSDGYQHVNPLLTYHIDINDLRTTIASLSTSHSPLVLLTQLGSEWQGAEEVYYSEKLKEVGEVCKELGVWLHVEGDRLWQDDELAEKRKVAAAAEKVKDESNTKNGNKRGSKTFLTSTLYQAADSIAFTTSSFSDGKLAVSAFRQRAPSPATPTSAGGQQGKTGAAVSTTEFAVPFDDFVQLFTVWHSLSAVPSLPTHLSAVNAALTQQLSNFKHALLTQPLSVYLISPVGELIDDVKATTSGSVVGSTHSHLFFQLTTSPPHEPSYFNLTVNDINTFLAYRLALRLRADVDKAADPSSLSQLYGTVVSPASYFDLCGFVFQPPYSSLTSQPAASVYDALFAAIAHELSILNAAAKARDELHHLLMQEHEFVYIPPSDLQNNPRVGVGAFRFIPSQVPAGHVDSLHHSLNKHLRRLPQWQWHGWPKSATLSVAGEPVVSAFRSAVTVRGETCTVVDVCPALLERGVSGLVSDVKVTAAHLSLPKRVMLDVSESVQRGIKEAERKLDEVTAQQYAPTSLVRWLPVVGSMINWAMPVHGEQHSAPGQSFDLRKKELNVVRYEYGANKAGTGTVRDTPTLPAAAGIDRPTSAMSLTPKGGDAPAQLTNSQPLSSTISAAAVIQSHQPAPVTPNSKTTASTATPASSSPATSSSAGTPNAALTRSVSTPHTSASPSSAVTPRHKRTISINIDEGEKAILQQPLRPLPDVLAFLTQGVVFTSYFPAPDTPPTSSDQAGLPFLSADLLIFYAPAFRASDGQPSQDATDLGTGPVLAWCEPNTRYMSADQCIAVEHIHELYLGRKAGWPGGVGGGERCLSIMTPQVSLWLEADSRGMRDDFFLALYALLQSLHPVRSRKRAVGPSTTTTNGERATTVAVGADGTGSVKSERSGTATPPAASTATAVVTSAPNSDGAVDPIELAAARQLLVHGMPFVVYVLDKHDTDVTSRHEVTLWFRPDTGTPSSSPLPSPTSASPPPSDSLVGHLCWCRRGPVLDYAPSRSLPITSTVQICLGKQTKALRNAAAADSPSDRCFSILCGRMILNLEAGTVDDRQLWLQAFHKLMTAAGKQRVFETDMATAVQAGAAGKRLVEG